MPRLRADHPMRNQTGSKPTPAAKETAVYLRIATKIHDQLRTGEFQVGAKLPSIRELSETYDVNYLTARQALKSLESRGLVSMETGRGTYVSPRRFQQQTIGVVVPDLGYKVNSGISRGIREESSGRNIVPIFMDFHNDVRVEKQHLQRLEADQFAGALIYPSPDQEINLQLLQMTFGGFPIVFIDRAPPEMPSWLVSSDDYEIGRLAAGHLIEAGCTTLACLRSPAQNLQERTKGFVDEANNRGVAVPSERMLSVGDIAAADSQQLTEKLMRLSPRPDGVFYFNDQYALVGLRRLHDMCIEVPRQVKIIGCDDIEATWHSRPTLTTIAQHPMEIGHQAFLMFLRMIETSREERLFSQHIRLPVELIKRESTGR